MIEGALHIPVDACSCRYWGRMDNKAESGHAETCPNRDRIAVDIEWLRYELNHLMREGMNMRDAFERIWRHLVREGPSSIGDCPRELNPF